MDRFSERDIDNLSVILDHCDRISDTIGRFGESLEIFISDSDYRDSVLLNILQIGEAVNRLSDECKDKIGDLPWHQMYGVRNIIVHGYTQIKDELIWEIVTKDIKNLRSRLEQELQI